MNIEHIEQAGRQAAIQIYTDSYHCIQLCLCLCDWVCACVCAGHTSSTLAFRTYRVHTSRNRKVYKHCIVYISMQDRDAEWVYSLTRRAYKWIIIIIIIDITSYKRYTHANVVYVANGDRYCLCWNGGARWYIACALADVVESIETDIGLYPHPNARTYRHNPNPGNINFIIIIIAFQGYGIQCQMIIIYLNFIALIFHACIWLCWNIWSWWLYFRTV